MGHRRKQLAFLASCPFLSKSTTALSSTSALASNPLYSSPRRRRRRPTVVINSTASSPSTSPEPAADTTPPLDPLEAFSENLKNSINKSFDTFLSPFLDSCSVLQRRWTFVGGNYILRPPASTSPRAVLHFLGGAFFAAAPHIVYRTFLERLCSRGYVVVATPFEIGFDYLSIAADIADRWERVETDLALDYGPLPVIGVGHSAGCVFHVLSSSLFDEEAPKAANVLISFNNRKAEDAIPMYKQLVVPTAAGAVSLNNALPEDLRNAINEFPMNLDAAVEGNFFTPKRLRENVIPTVKESRKLVEQVWPLLEELVGTGPRVEDGAASGEATKQAADAAGATEVREFYPSPEEIEKSVSSLYAVEKTLVVQFRNDTLDDSEDLASALRSKEAFADVNMITIEGSHLTPLAQDLPDFVSPPMSGARSGQGTEAGLFGALGVAAQEAVNAFGLRELTALESVIDEWVRKGIETDEF